MWIVRVALSRPYTFIVLALLILLISPLVILRTPTDIFPNVNIPVVAVLWNYTGLSAEEMEERITTAVRARADHVGQRHGAHRVADGERAQYRQGLFPSRRESRDGGGAGDGAGAIERAADAAGHHAAVHPGLQRVQRADPATGAFGQGADRAAAVRLRDAAASARRWRRCRARRFRGLTAESSGR